MTLLRVDDVSVRRGRNTVVRDVSLQVARGETVAVLGPNGAGKSSLLEAVGGVIGTASGSLTVDGRVASVLQTPGEPFAGLDAETRASLCEDTSSALRDVAGGVLIVLHDRGEAWALADRLVVMLDGQVAAAGPPRDLLAAPPTAEVARFLGYDGELRDGDRLTLTLTRAPDVLIDPDGDLEATVTRVTPQQDGVRIELHTPRGTVRSWSSDADLRTGDRVRVRVTGGVSFPA